MKDGQAIVLLRAVEESIYKNTVEIKSAQLTKM